MTPTASITKTKTTEESKFIRDLKKKIRRQISRGETGAVRQSLQKLQKLKPRDPELFSLFAEVLLAENNPDEAEKVLLEGLKRHGETFTLLYNLGRVDERKGEYLNAYDLYRRAELQAPTDQLKKQAQKTILSTREKISGGKEFHQDSYKITLHGNRQPVELDYKLPRLAARKRILDALLAHLDTGSRHVMELECAEGIIARNLADHGYLVRAVAPTPHAALKGIGLEFPEKFRRDITIPPEYAYMQLDETNADRLQETDVVMLLPESLEWYRRRGIESCANILACLARKARRQFFFYLPKPNTDTKLTSEEENHLLQALRPYTLNGEEPLLCLEHKGRHLYRIDRDKTVKANRDKILPRGVAAACSEAQVFEVEVDKCRDFNGFAYPHWGWNHFVALIEQLKEYPELDYKDTVLKKFYNGFAPANMQELLFPQEKEPLPPLNQGWASMPWREGNHFFARERPTTRPGGNHQFGPNTDEFGSRELKKIRSTYRLINRYGYLPEIFPDGYILGYFLKWGDDYRFIVNEGQHRMAVAGALGYETVKCKHNPAHPRVVDFEEIDHWPQVKSGFYDRDTAEKVFKHYFQENYGAEIWSQLGNS